MIRSKPAGSSDRLDVTVADDDAPVGLSTDSRLHDGDVVQREAGGSGAEWLGRSQLDPGDERE